MTEMKKAAEVFPSCWDAGKVARLLGEAGLQRVREAAIRAMRPAWGILTRSAGLDELPIGGSHFGGSPDLPAGAAWPADANGPLSFLGQLRVEDLSALDAERLLPGSGLFSFFLDPEDGGESAAKVLFTAPGARLERLSTPPGAESRAYLPCALELRAFPSLPEGRSSEVEGWGLSGEEADAYGDLRWDLLEAHGIDSDRVHQVFGYPCSIDYDVFREAADEGARWTAGESRLLLQIDEDEQLGTRWGDCGRIFLVLPAPALRELRLDRVVYIFQCV
jgi:hypothetical protein